jgi:azurin
VFVQPKSADEVAMAALMLAEKGFEVGFVPESDKIIASTKLLDNAEEEVLEFTAPEKPGEYEFVCTFPGHHMSMRGIMKVVK